MRDGTRLLADVYRPAGDGPWPVLLCRTPYGKSHQRYTNLARRLCSEDYLVVVQDVRGRNASGGDWVWHLSPDAGPSEAEDGYESCEWAARLPGADGQVGTFGNSYPSWFTWHMAGAQPPALKAIASSGFSTRVLDCTFGVFETGIRLRWQHMMAVSSRRRTGDTDFPATVEESHHRWDALLRGRWLWHLPLDDVPDSLFGPDAAKQRQYWQDIARELWALDALHPQVTVPTLTLTGWWDRLSTCVAHFVGMRENGPVATRDTHRLVIGPWLHDIEGREDWAGPRDYGPEARLDLVAELRRFYDHHLKGLDTGITHEPPVRLYLANDTAWSSWSNWPPPEAAWHQLLLGSGGQANTPAGNGVLDRQAGQDGSDSYTYDPADPVPSLVGADGQAAACDQRPLHTRQDILVYQTPALDGTLTVIGRPECVLWVAVDTPDTDIVARLVEVGPDGTAFNLCQALLRLRYREGFDREVAMVAGRATEVTLSLPPVGIRLCPGSRLRLDITSSDFPSFDRNHNTGAPFHSDAALRPARVTLLHGPAHPSRLVLPVIADG